MTMTLRCRPPWPAPSFQCNAAVLRCAQHGSFVGSILYLKLVIHVQSSDRCAYIAFHSVCAFVFRPAVSVCNLSLHFVVHARFQSSFVLKWDRFKMRLFPLISTVSRLHILSLYLRHAFISRAMLKPLFLVTYVSTYVRVGLTDRPAELQT